MLNADTMNRQPGMVAGYTFSALQYTIISNRELMTVAVYCTVLCMTSMLVVHSATKSIQ